VEKEAVELTPSIPRRLALLTELGQLLFEIAIVPEHTEVPEHRFL
jgi:hypothetical protein